MKACIQSTKNPQKATRCAYIQSVSGPTTRPYSVAWISRRLAEPATRVRIAVGPLFSVPCERFVSNSPFMARPLMLLRMTIEWALGIDGHRVPSDSHEP